MQAPSCSTPNFPKQLVSSTGWYFVNAIDYNENSDQLLSAGGINDAGLSGMPGFVLSGNGNPAAALYRGGDKSYIWGKWLNNVFNDEFEGGAFNSDGRIAIFPTALRPLIVFLRSSDGALVSSYNYAITGLNFNFMANNLIGSSIS